MFYLQKIVRCDWTRGVGDNWQSKTWCSIIGSWPAYKEFPSDTTPGRQWCTGVSFTTVVQEETVKGADSDGLMVSSQIWQMLLNFKINESFHNYKWSFSEEPTTINIQIPKWTFLANVFHSTGRFPWSQLNSMLRNTNVRRNYANIKPGPANNFQLGPVNAATELQIVA